MSNPAWTRVVLAQIFGERAAQDRKWGEQNHADGTGLTADKDIADAFRQLCDIRAKHGTLCWRDILQEEVAEAFAEQDPVALRTELIQVAAVATAWVEAIDRRLAKNAGDINVH